MAEAYKCDRCKAFFDGKPFASASVRPTAEAGETRFYKMVCEPCAEDTKKYIEGGIDSAVEANIAILQVLKNVGVDTECAACVQIAFTGTGANASEHTRSPRPAFICDRECCNPGDLSVPVPARPADVRGLSRGSEGDAG